MIIPEKYIKVLADLGLTHTEAKVYITLLCLKCATASQLHIESNIARQDVYQVLSQLQDKELIEKAIAKPTKFTPVTPKDAILMLFQRKKDKNLQRRKKADQMFRNFIENCPLTKPFDERLRFVLLSKSETDPTGHIDKPGKSVVNAQKEVIGVVTLPLFMKVKQMNENIWKEAVRRRVNFRFMIGMEPSKKFDLSLDPLLKNSDCFEIRKIFSAIPAAVLLVDDREVFCRLGVRIDNSVLWSLAPSFVAMIRDYLETKWKSLENNRT